ncbi:MAG: 3-dehydroquinate synthase [Weeksellaceae bacterium]|nr:3-dehydroquinate synthase [Weeksellaceae bacterium]
MQITPVFFNDGFQALKDYIRDSQFSEIIVLLDDNTYEHCFTVLVQHLVGYELRLINIAPGEGSKSPEILHELWHAMLEMKADRNSLLINLGGGMITDVGGFLASTYKRGISFVNVPTSLLAMVDASLGGKNGINVGGFKNQVGTFTSPDFTLIETEFLKTLPEREMLAGFAEMLKHGLIADRIYWDVLKFLRADVPADNHTDWTVYIKRSVEIKTTIVENDFYEQKARKTLNFGHTLGHAIESYFSDKSPILHGEAVAVGMILEAHMSVQAGYLSEAEFSEIAYHISELYTKIELPSYEDLRPYLVQDKKNVKGSLRFMPLLHIGKCSEIASNATPGQIRRALESYSQES